MNCLEFRRQCLAEPDTRERAYLQHKTECTTCAGLAERVARLDQGLEEAMRLPVPEGLESRILLRQTTGRRRSQRRLYGWFAVAATLMLMVGIAQFNHILLRPVSLEYAVINEFNAHPDLYLSRVSADSSEIQRQFARGGIQLKGKLAGLIRAHYCTIHGVDGLHLVFLGEHGLVSVLVMPKNAVLDRVFLADGNRRGYITPADGSGSLAFLGNPGEAFDAIEREVRQSIVF